MIKEQQDNKFDQILRPGVNCWGLEDASHVSVIIDAADYFSAFAEASRAARRQILIIGWDFDRLDRLYRDDKDRGLPDQLGAFLIALVRRKRNLHVYLLSWDFNMIYAVERELLPALRLRLQAPRRFHFRLDGKHPSGASHHQKVVVIDDQVAFVGGIDLSRWRWDTAAHIPNDPRRVDPKGKAYPPFHDLMVVLEGRAAARLGELARQRWRTACGRRVKPVEGQEPSPWPPSVAPQLRSVQVAIARTMPSYAGRAAVNEVKQLYLDAIASARRFIYIENQYFTARSLADAICKRLSETDGPEVILVLPEKTQGWLEQVTMDVLRERVLYSLHRADKWGRLGIFYPYQPDLGDACVCVHAKLMIIDDRLVRIGSSNASSRSMGLDTECDLIIEAREKGDAVTTFIQTLRLKLLGEHLDCPAEHVAKAETDNNSLLTAIATLRSDGRSLREHNCSVPSQLDEMIPDASIVDPSEPVSPDYFVREYVPDKNRSIGRRRLFLFLILITALLALAGSWRWTPLQEWLSPQRMNSLLATISSTELRVTAAITGITLASLFMVPITLLAVVAGMVLDGWQAFICIMTGAVASAAFGFSGGRLFSRDAIERISGSRLGQLSKQLASRGVVAVAVLRLVPIAPFAIFNLMAGASHLGFYQFLLGTILGLAPGLGAITLFSNTLRSAVVAPSWQSVATAGLVGLVLVVLSLLAKRWLRSG